MRLKTWLLTGTSIGLMAFAPISAYAQDAELQSAYQAYLEAQASGDASALEAAQTALTELCIVGGYTSLEECIAALEAAGTAPAAEEPVVEEEAPAEEPVAEEPAPVEEPAPAEEPMAEEPAPEPPPAEAPAAEEPAAEQPAPEEPVAEEPAPEEPAAEPAPAQEDPVAEEPVMEEAPAEEAPAAEEAAPAGEQPVEDPAAEVEAGIEAQLSAQVDAHNAAVADLAAGADATEAQARIDAALAQITAICGTLGYMDMEACLAEFGLTLSPLPEPTPAEEQPMAPAPGDEQPAPVEETTSEGEPAEMVEELPEGVTEEQIAPVLDSAKDEEAAPSESAQPVEGEAAVEAETEAQVEASAEEPPPPPPANDEEAQSEAIRTLAAEPIAAVNAEEGEAVTAEESATVNQTIVNNYVTNITTNVTGDNNTVTTGSQQTPVTVVEAPEVQASNGDAFAQLILQVGTQLIVNSVGLDTERFYDPQEDEIYYERLSNNRVREVITRPDGTQIITVRNRNGDILRRSRITPDGREYVLAYFDESYYDDLERWRDPAEDLPPLRLNIPVREYVLDASYADEDELEVFFSQPPVEQVARLYSIDEVKRSARLRDSVRRLEIGNLTFDTGAATIERSQVQALSGVANAMLTLLERNPNETFLIEGHTDAIGSDIANLRLSDLRAATVARVLTDFYGVPPENLATQGYGERYLKIRTEAAERENRRVTIRRITPLITLASR